MRDDINNILQRLAPDRFVCKERMGRGLMASERSEIDKPVDLHICLRESGQNNDALVCIEVADVNSPQMVGEAARLFYDCCPRKLLVIGVDNAPNNAVELCVKILTRLYGQGKIENTPCRIHKMADLQGLEQALKDLLCI